MLFLFLLIFFNKLSSICKALLKFLIIFDFSKSSSNSSPLIIIFGSILISFIFVDFISFFFRLNKWSLIL